MKNLKLAARSDGPATVVRVAGAEIGARLTIIAGPCSVESEEQTFETARAVKAAGADLLRGGAFKPRTSPYAFQGLGLRALKILAAARQQTGLPVVTEVLDPRDVSWVAEYADVLQVGTRNMQNFSLLKEVGRCGRPVVLKRGMYATIEEWLNCAEYILNEGNPDVILCERGVRTFERFTRNTLDLSAVPAIKQLSHLPIIVDPTHATGVPSLIEPMSCAAVASGADGLMVEVHWKPEEALCDGDQALTPTQFAALVATIRRLETFSSDLSKAEASSAAPVAAAQMESSPVCRSEFIGAPRPVPLQLNTRPATRSKADGRERDRIRRRIDEIDLDLLSLLEERMELGLKVRRFKSQPADAGREAEVLARATTSGLALVEANFAGRLFGEIMTESKRIQEVGHLMVAFQGEHGAYSELAARGLVPRAAYLPCPDFGAVFKGVEAGSYDVGVVPVENSLEGAVSQVNDQLARSPLFVVGEIWLPVHHLLLAPPGVDHKQIRVVYSHPQALAQCRDFIGRNGLEARPFYNTAGAARMIARERPEGSAAVASGLAAELYGLQVIKEGIEDDSSNATRFVLLCREPAAQGDKCSLVFTTRHEAGQLYVVLGLFADARINLTRLASMPVRTDPGRYSFFLDFEGSIAEERVRRAVAGAERICDGFRFLGCYPRAV